MIDLILIVGLIITVMALVCGIYAQGYSVSDVLAAGWLRIKEMWQDWRR